MAKRRTAPLGSRNAAAHARRAARAAEKDARIEWNIDNVASKVAMTMKQRIVLATGYVHQKVVSNISQPVVKAKRKGRDGKMKTVVVERSKPGEFPRADTSQLMRTIFKEVREIRPGVFEGYIGTPLEYGAILELSKRLDRSFLVRTLNEQQGRVRKILTGPMK